jgi:hypothetical protein
VAQQNGHDAPALPPLDPESRVWAIRASNAPLEELAAIRASAEQWRNGLAGLTALLAAGSLIASPSLTDRIPPGWRLLVGLLALAGLLTLLYGTWCAMNGAFGVPGDKIMMTSEGLRNWEHREATAALTAITRARSSFLTGMLFIIAATAAAFIVVPSSNVNIVQVDSRIGMFCGQLEASRPRPWRWCMK